MELLWFPWILITGTASVLGVFLVWAILGTSVREPMLVHIETDPSDPGQCLLVMTNRGFKQLLGLELYVGSVVSQSPPSWLTETWSNPVYLDSLYPGRQIRLRLGPKPGPQDRAEAAEVKAYIVRKGAAVSFIKWTFRLDFALLERMI